MWPFAVLALCNLALHPLHELHTHGVAAHEMPR